MGLGLDFWFKALRCTAFVGLILLAKELSGQRARLFSTDAELSSSLIDDIHQDYKGIIWIATEEGINKYDGSKFTVYKKNENGILHNYVRLMFEDHDDNLFFGYFNGLQKYNRDKDSFTRIPLLLASGSEYGAHVLSMIQRKDGTIMVGTSGHGVFALKESRDSLIAHQLPEVVPSFFVNKLFEDSKENLWIMTQDKGLFLLDQKGSLINFFDPNAGSRNSISSICEDNNGNIYIGSLDRGLFKYNDQLRDFEHVSSASKSLAIEALFLTDDNNLLIGTDGEGLKLYEPSQGSMSDLNFNVSNFDFSKSKVHNIMQDEDGNYWLGLFQKGVVLIPSRVNNFKYIGYQSVLNNTIGSNYIMSVFEDTEGILWVGTDSDGLYAARPSGQRLNHFSKNTTPNAPNTVMCMFEDSQGTFWIGSYINGISRLDREKGVFDKLNQMVDNQSNPISGVMDITEDNSQTLWVATLGFGVFSMDLVTGEIQNFSGRPNDNHPNDAVNSIHNSWIICLLVSRDDKLYIGTFDGLNVYDLKTKTFKLLNTIRPTFWGQIIQTMYEDNNGLIWVGTSQGLICYNPNSEQIITYTTEDGLPSNGICAIEADDKQNLWISTNYGISKFDTRQKVFSNFYYHDGIQGNEFSKRGSFKNQSGTIYFSGINGITSFQPEEIEVNKDQLEVEIVGFYIQDWAVKAGMKSGAYDIVNTSVINADTFHLSSDDNSFSIEFSCMEYMNPKRITYQYSMKDDNWISLQQGSNSVAFNNLKPGNYRFRVRAKDFTTFSEVKEIQVIIHPPWYLSSWAKFGYSIISLLVILGVAAYFRQRYETRKRLREHQHTRQINEAKLEFFTNISHEIRTPLSLIINPLRKLISVDQDDKRQKAYQVMRRNTEKILHLVNQIMDLRQIDKGKIRLRFRETEMATFVKETVDIFEESILAKHINFSVHHDPHLPKVWVDQNYFDKTIQNVLSNAIKFTPENGQIDLYITADSQAERLKITCTDSGIGLKESDLEKIFDRFYQASSHQGETTGNGIGLHLTRSIIDLHHGTIHAENNPARPGSSFVIMVPLGKSHLEESEMVIPIDQPDRYHSHSLENLSSVPISKGENERAKSKSKRWVLVVDDDEEIRNYICNELSSDYHMLESETGKEGLSMALDKKPDLIISDVVMPEMDGISLCKKIKQNVNINHIPVILLTARSSERDNLEGLGIGADAYISKPFSMEILKKTVDNIVRNRELLKNNFSGKQEQSDKVEHIEIKSADEKLMQKIMNIINANLDNPNLNVEMIAEEIGISRVHLYRKLKAITNQSVSDLIRNIRLKQAAELLSSKNIGISEVAYATGFSNPSKFSTSFKNFYGVSPSDYSEKGKHNPSGFKPERN